MSLVSGGSLFCTALCFGVWLSVVVLYCSVFWCVVVCCCSVLLCVLACGCLLLFCTALWCVVVAVVLYYVSGGSLLFSTALCFGLQLSFTALCSVCGCSCCPDRWSVAHVARVVADLC